MPIDIAVALLLRDGHVLITLRDAEAHQGGLWEFPGGKRERNEDMLACLRREVQEETGLQIDRAELFHQTLYRYPDRSVHLHFFLCQLDAADCSISGRWVRLEELDTYDFPDGNQDILSRLKQI